MNARKFLAACTAVTLALGFSIGASSAAVAEDFVDDTTAVVVESQVEESPEESEGAAEEGAAEEGAAEEGAAEEGAAVQTQRTAVATTPRAAPAVANNGPIVGGPHPDGGANKVDICHATPPDTAAQGWVLISPDDDAVATNQAGHASEHDMDIIPSFQYWYNTGSGNGPNSNWVKLTYGGKNLTTNFAGVTGAQILANDCERPPTVLYEVGLYLYKKLDANAPASWPNSGPQTLIDYKAGTEWFTEFPGDLPRDVCGPGWAVQQDKVSYTGTFTWPESITYPHDNIGWPPIYAAQHADLEDYIDVPDCEEATAAVTVVERDCFTGTTFDIDEAGSENVTWGDEVIDLEAGTISITATATGDALFEDGLDGVSDDRTQRTFSAPYEPAGGDDCVAPSIDVTAAFTQLTCDPDSGSFAVGLFDPTDENADKLLWTTTEGTVPSETANTVSEPGVVTVTVRVANAYLGDFAVNETSSLGTVSVISVDGVETALITWTFTFTEPDDCELGAVVVPLVTEVDFCEGAGPNALRVATFTVTDAENVTYEYTVNGGSPIAIDFDGEETVTISVNPLDAVVVTATAADGFVLPDGYEPWTHTFIGAAFCPGTFPSTVAAAEMVMPDCDGNPGRVILTNEGGVIWRIDGEVVAGNITHTVTPDTTITLTAELEGPTEENPGGWAWNDPEQQTEWVQAFPMPDDCSPELAFTGSSAMTSWIGVAAALLTLVGMGFVLRRHRVEA